MGKYPLVIELAGFESVEREVEVKENAFTDLGLIKLQRSVGAAQIISTPPGQRFEIAFKPGKITGDAVVERAGVTPATLENLPSGQYNGALAARGLAGLPRRI